MGDAGDVRDVGDIRDRHQGASVWATAPASTGVSATPPLIEATWHPTKADGQPAGDATSSAARGAKEPPESGVAGTDVGAGSRGEEVADGSAEGDEPDGDEPEGDEAGAMRPEEAVSEEAHASGRRPDDESGSGPG